MGNLLFSPEGQIGRDAFQKGAVILLAVNFFLWPVWYVGLGLGFFVMLASFVLIYCWACLFVKRLRAANKPAAWFLLIFLVFVFASQFVGNVILTVLSPEMAQEITEVAESTDRKNPDLDVLLPFYERFFKALAIPYAAAYLIVGAAIAFIFNSSLDDRSGL